MEHGLNYYGVLFHNCHWDDICRCCIVAPDCAFCWHYEEYYDAIVVLWKEDEEESEKPRTRTYLNSILSALAILLYSKISSRVEYTIVHLNRGSTSNGLMPSINLNLWWGLFGIGRYSFKSIQNINELKDGSHPATMKLPPSNVFREAGELWENLIYEKLKYFFISIDNAKEYLLLQPIIDEWLTYYYEFPTTELEILRTKIRFQPWYAEVMKSIPHLNPLGLIVIELPSIERYALYDYYPELNRYFVCREDNTFENLWHVELCAERSEDIPLPREINKHLHLLPKSKYNEETTFPFRVLHIPCAYFYDERWLGNDYVWDRADIIF